MKLKNIDLSSATRDELDAIVSDSEKISTHLRIVSEMKADLNNLLSTIRLRSGEEKSCEEVCPRKKDFYPTWQEASVAARKLGFKTSREYFAAHSRDNRLHSQPRIFYEDFPGWDDFLGKSSGKKEETKTVSYHCSSYECSRAPYYGEPIRERDVIAKKNQLLRLDRSDDADDLWMAWERGNMVLVHEYLEE